MLCLKESRKAIYDSLLASLRAGLTRRGKNMRYQPHANNMIASSEGCQLKLSRSTLTVKNLKSL
jgi:hypothetical protein